MKWGSSSSFNITTEWTSQENKLFENALAIFDSDTPDRWEKVASRVPGKSPFQIRKHYESLVEDVKFIDSGLFPIPSYFREEWGSDGFLEEFGMDEFQVLRAGRKVSDQERKKGIPWTEEEHKLFLMGLNKYGKGDWRSISRNFVVTRTPTQVASHAQKYFIRLNSGSKDRRRPSIHDITSVGESVSTRSRSNDQPLSSISAPSRVDSTLAVAGSVLQSCNTPTSGSRSMILQPNPAGLYDFNGGFGNYP